MRRLRVLSGVVSLVLVLGTVGCGAAQLRFRYESDSTLRALTAHAAPAIPPTRFAVLSDLHLYDTSLGIEGAAFEEVMAQDRKLLRESGELLRTASAAIAKEKPDFVLVSGDLTKDGEKSSHELVVEQLKALEATGTQVFVVPGNHDILNGWSRRYEGDQTVRVPNINADDFARMYADLGYSQAIARDSSSLSYLAEPKPGLWLLALDACRYRDNREDKEETVGGAFLPATLTWIEDRLAEAAQQNKPVIVMMHHGVLEHYVGQAKNYGDYLVADYPEVSRLFAAYNVRMVFTGHYHAQDITSANGLETGRFLFDVETGSLATYPNPYRLVTISADQQVTLQAGHITSIPSHTDGFVDFSRQSMHEGVAGIAVKTLKGYLVGQSEAELLGGQIADAFMAHYYGDESLPAGQEIIRIRGLSVPAWVVVTMRKSMVSGLWHDLSPADNNVTLDLKTGQAR